MLPAGLVDPPDPDVTGITDPVLDDRAVDDRDGTVPRHLIVADLPAEVAGDDREAGDRGHDAEDGHLQDRALPTHAAARGVTAPSSARTAAGSPLSTACSINSRTSTTAPSGSSSTVVSHRLADSHPASRRRPLIV